VKPALYGLDFKLKQVQHLRMRWFLAFVLACVIPVAALSAAEDVARKLKIGGGNFSQSEIIDARAQPGLDGKSGIIMTLEADAIKRLAGVIAVNAATPIPVLLDGKLVAEPVIERASDGDWVELRGDYTLEQAVALAKLISGKDPLRESLDEGP
jgi:preprotein translocase subunit SecD